MQERLSRPSAAVERSDSNSGAFPGRRRRGLWICGAIALAALLRANVHAPDLVVTRIDHCPEIGCDFVHHYLPQARQLFSERGELVFGWVYPPFLALALQVLTPLSDAAALRVWMFLQFASAAWLVVQCRGALRPTGRWTSWAAAFTLVALSLPVVHAVKWGQVSLPVAVVAVYALQHRGRLAAALLGGLAALKLYPLVYCVRPFLRREFRFIAVVLAWMAGAGILLPLVVLGPQATWRFFQAALHVRLDTVAYLGGQALWPTFVRWFVDGRHAGLEAAGSRALLVSLGGLGFDSAGGVLRLALSLAPAVVVGWITLQRLRRADLEPRAAAALLLVTTGLCLPPGWHHYFAFLPFVIAIVLGDARRGTAAFALAIAAWVLAALPLLLLADVPGIYFHASAWGCTTFAALAAWLALVVGVRAAPRSE